MRAIAPPGAVVAESQDERDGDAPLHPDEVPLVARAIAKRRREFAAGRSCARRALAQLGLHDVAVLAGPSREPLWPAGVVGSITHSQGYCAAAVGWEAEIGGIGIDAERHAPLDRGVAELVCTPVELEWISASPSGVHWETVIFSAKEALYKAWFPATYARLDFQDVSLRMDPRSGEFRAQVARSLAAGARDVLESVAGRFTISAPFVLTSAQLARPGVGEGRA